MTVPTTALTRLATTDGRPSTAADGLRWPGTASRARVMRSRTCGSSRWAMPVAANSNRLSTRLTWGRSRTSVHTPAPSFRRGSGAADTAVLRDFEGHRQAPHPAHDGVVDAFAFAGLAHVTGPLEQRLGHD